MLKTNSKTAKNRIRAYIVENYDGSGYGPEDPETTAATLEEIATVILKDVKRVKGCYVRPGYKYTWFNAFQDWSQGLPGLLNTCYHYNINAVDLLGDILEETPAERARFTESAAEEMLDRLIYRELTTAAPNILR